MWVSRKEFEELKARVDQQEAIIHNLILELEERKQAKKPTYFG